MNYAVCIAKLLEADAVAAGQVKEHISRERLLELLDIEPEIVTETEYEVADTVEESLEGFDDEEILRYMKKRFSKIEILKLVA